MKLFTLIFFFYTQMVFASLSSSEMQIRDYLSGQKQSQLSLLKHLVDINSGTANLKGIRQVGELLRPEFAALGFKTYWVNQPAYLHRAGTLIAERQGTKGKRVLLIGHLDTVFSAPSQRFDQGKTKAKGPGVIDDKGGVVVLLYALKALQAAHALEDVTIYVVLTGDEEDSGKPTSISRKPLLKIARQSDVALDFEGSISQSTGTPARRGVSHWTVKVEGNAAHSATIFQSEVGAGAIFELARILNDLRLTLSHERYVSFNPGIILGGTNVNYDAPTSQGTAFGKQNVIAKTAFVTGDFRYISAQQKKAIESKMQAVVRQHLSGTKATITFQSGIPAMQPTAGNLKLLKKYSQVSADLGFGTVEPLDASTRGAGDISYVAERVSANLAGLGPSGLGSHTLNEQVDLNSITVQTERAALLIYRLTQN
jgi:glutamate carboxypeptidase